MHERTPEVVCCNLMGGNCFFKTISFQSSYSRHPDNWLQNSIMNISGMV